jgi:hypothetical protein
MPPLGIALQHAPSHRHCGGPFATCSFIPGTTDRLVLLPRTALGRQPTHGGSHTGSCVHGMESPIRAGPSQCRSRRPKTPCAGRRTCRPRPARPPRRTASAARRVPLRGRGSRGGTVQQACSWASQSFSGLGCSLRGSLHASVGHTSFPVGISVDIDGYKRQRLRCVERSPALRENAIPHNIGSCRSPLRPRAPLSAASRRDQGSVEQIRIRSIGDGSRKASPPARED